MVDNIQLTRASWNDLMHLTHRGYRPRAMTNPTRPIPLPRKNVSSTISIVVGQDRRDHHLPPQKSFHPTIHVQLVRSLSLVIHLGKALVCYSMNDQIDWNHITTLIDKHKYRDHSARNAQALMKEMLLTISVVHERVHTTSKFCERAQVVTIPGHDGLVQAVRDILRDQMDMLDRIERDDGTPRQ